MSLKFDDLPKLVQTRIEQIVEEKSLPREIVVERYITVYNLDFIANAPSKKFRHIWASQKLHSDFFSKPLLKKHNIVPIGVDGVKKFPDQDPSLILFALDVDSGKRISITVDKKALLLIDDITLGEYYPDIDLAVTERGYFHLDDRTELPEPQPYMNVGEGYPESIDDLLTNPDFGLKIREIQMKDFGNAKLISKRIPTLDKSSTYADSMDWVCIRNCMVLSSRKINVKGMDGVFRGQLQVTDSSVAEEITTSKGIVIGNRMSVWVAPRHMYPDYSVLNLWGPVEHRTWQQKDPNDPSKKIDRQNFQMTAYYAFPLVEGPESDE